jgi:hypothetical protein
MDKRTFLAATAVTSATGVLSARTALAATPPDTGPALLTIVGDVGKTNRGPLDPALDQMMAKHKVQFDKAFGFSAPALRKLPAVTIKPTLEYDAKVHTLSGPLLGTVLEAAGVTGTSVRVGLRAVDGYNVAISLQDARSYRMIVATHMDGQPLALGGLGPQWAVYDADRLADFKDKPLKDRFGLCPWGLYLVDVRNG